MDTNVQSHCCLHARGSSYDDPFWRTSSDKLTAMSVLLENDGIEGCRNRVPERTVQLSINILTNWDELELLRAEWTAILERNRKLT